MLGSDLLNKKYEPLFDYYSDLAETAFRVCNDAYVTDDSGTGVVHQVSKHAKSLLREDDTRDHTRLIS